MPNRLRVTRTRRPVTSRNRRSTPPRAVLASDTTDELSRLRAEVIVLRAANRQLQQEVSDFRRSLIEAEATITALDLELAEWEKGNLVSVYHATR